MFAWLHRKPTPASESKRRVREALIDYPRYEPPRWTSDTQSRLDASKEYATYFLDNRNLRVGALSKFLEKFDVALSLDDEGVRAVSRWCPIYADLLVDDLDGHDTWCAYRWFQAPWTDHLIGLNPIFDLGVYMGECILSRNKRLKWLPVLNPELNKGASHPIFGQRCRRPFDPINSTYTECKNTHFARVTKKTPNVLSFYMQIKARAME